MSRTSTRQVPQRTGFAKRFHEALAADGRTMETFARDIDVTLRTVQHWRAGTSEPQGRTLVQIADALGRDPSWFYAETEAA